MHKTRVVLSNGNTAEIEEIDNMTSKRNMKRKPSNSFGSKDDPT